MSSQILQALTKLFALITRQDGGATEFERKFVIDYFVKELDQDSVHEYTKLYDEEAEYGKVQDNKVISMKDSVRILKFCREINKGLEQRQKIIILIKLLELVASDKNFTAQRRMIIDTIASAFNLKEEYTGIESFVLSEDSSTITGDDILVASTSNKLISPEAKYLKIENLQGEITFKQIKSADLYFVKYVGEEDVRLNGFAMKRNEVSLFSNGSSIRLPRGGSIYYGDITAKFLENLQGVKLSFSAKNIQFTFASGDIGLREMSISETQGKLIGIMGGSGAGKTTLMNALSGIETPSGGSVKINGIDIHQDKKKIEGVIGFIAQDDLLIEELTVYQNLYYNAKLCFDKLSEKDIHDKVMNTLDSLGLEHIKHITVGNVLNKKISGGQRKRLNIALELIREPAVMFVDEPTSGLSSKDSQNVIDLLKELSLKGKLIFVVIHQPSSDIYKTFDKMIILDKGGYLIYYGNPIEAIVYFKRETNQADSGRYSENPEEMFKIIEKEVVDEFGQETGKRQLTPQQWHERFENKIKFDEVEEIKESPPSSLNRPNIFKQAYLFTIRDFLAKISNTQYMLINLLEAPILAFLLAFIIRFQNEPSTGDYVFRYNDNIPAYVLICVIISLFMGLTVSAEEIIKDKKIQKREQFLNLSRFSYLVSKLIILFLLSAIQSLTFAFIGNLILEIDGELWSYWLVLFSTSCFANVLGLNISSTFNSVITIYITIPLLLIPQMILSGIIFRYEKMNKVISEKGKVPLLADIMVSRWAFEAIAVDHFMNNQYMADYYKLEQNINQNNYKITYWIPALKTRLERTLDNQKKKPTDSIKNVIRKDLALVRHEIKYENAYVDKYLKNYNLDSKLTPQKFDEVALTKLVSYFDSITVKFQEKVNEATKDKENLPDLIKKNRDAKYDINKAKNRYYNDGLEIFVTNFEVKDRFVEHEGKILQQIYPVYNEPKEFAGWWDYRTHFCAPKKHFAGMLFETYYFNIGVIWLFTFLLYITLYFDFFKTLLGGFGKISLGKKSK
ncbi:MAG: ATP-binding cassette domain-containing protein [Microscillaceae bacterium]|jgi:ABC-type multidrug transport system ATPase subunit|nr:ATP-binding cassette domain-containing protein [Microscillaceae bacterium]